MSEMLTKDFSKAEFRCQCAKCDGGFMDDEFMVILQAIRDRMREPMRINSGYRCPAHNASLPQSAAKSWHLYGRAADIHVPDTGFARRLVYNAMRVGIGGIGVDKTFIHLDSGPIKKLWSY